MSKTLDEYIEEAGEEGTIPPMPKGGIPKQWVPASIRYLIWILFFPFIHLDLAMQKIAKWFIRPPFKRIGKCKKRGNCCYYILLKKSRGPLGWISLFWNTQINGFYKRGGEVFDTEGKERIVMGCRYLKDDGSCKIYPFRPVVCRKWPVIEHFGYPKILKGCGFKAVTKTKNPLKIL